MHVEQAGPRPYRALGSESRTLVPCSLYVEQVDVGEKYVPQFKAGKEIRERLNR